jgi:hypothetical protein
MSQYWLLQTLRTNLILILFGTIHMFFLSQLFCISDLIRTSNFVQNMLFRHCADNFKTIGYNRDRKLDPELFESIMTPVISVSE